MAGWNGTSINMFILIGITDLPWLQKVLFVLVFFFYILDVLGNLIIVCIVIRDPSLHYPMYFLLANLSFVDICFSSITVPKMMVGFFMENTISLQGCVAQMYFFHFLGCTEGFLLASMGYDRYVAICNPLRYKTLMRKTVCIQLVFTSWVIGLTTSLVHAIMTSELPFCNSNKIKHFFCDVKPVIKLACVDTRLNEAVLTNVLGFLSTSTFSLTIISYVYIILKLTKIRSSQGRSKAFSTCSSHLTVVILFYGTAMCTYLGPSSEESIEKDRIAAVLFTVITPAMNPVIYTLRNQEVRKSMKKLIKHEYL
ncbi:olfactory receptor 12D1-like [Hyla sarda]|uniref:olfactory receptor 12D1-like n=1 Tax=Hyla sarda TaxID=327740 RepID=UPI0024C37B39|nr:olfactory receptor 12D1-like [Hyla sarda]